MIRWIVVMWAVLLCQADPWKPLDKFEKNVLSSDASSTLLLPLLALVDERVNPVLANLTRSWGHVCMTVNNTVPARDWSKKNPLKLVDRVAPWSIAVDILRHSKSINQISASQFTRRCESLPSQLLQSVKYGERICTLRLFDPRKSCQILNKYSRIYWIGNSLTRQTLIGLHGLLSSNLQSIHKYTANTRYPQFEISAKLAQEQCQCDGQYSMHSVCKSSYRLQDLSEGIVNACSDVMGESFWKSSFDFQYYHHSQTKEFHLDCGSNAGDTRPIFLYLQGGNADAPMNDVRENGKTIPPSDFDIPAYFKKTLSAFIVRYEKFYQHCPHGTKVQLHIAFSGVNAQNRLPHETVTDIDNVSVDNLLKLNDRLTAYVKKWHPTAHVIDFFNITVVSGADTADGYHYLTSTNIQKAMTLLRLMDLVQS